MKKITISFLLLVLVFFPSKAQDTGISAEVFYPIQMPREYQGDLTGILGIAFQFQFTDNDFANFGAEYRYEMIQGVYQTQYTDPTYKTYSFSNLGLFGKLTLNRDETFKLYTGLGMDIFDWGNTGGKRKFLGYYASGGVYFDILDQWYLFTNYQYSRATKKDNSGNYTYREYLNTLRFGFGFNF